MRPPPIAVAIFPLPIKAIFREDASIPEKSKGFFFVVNIFFLQEG